MDLTGLLDYFGTLRYGVPTSEKERLAVTGALPGAPQDLSADQESANRYAAGYLFGLQHPGMAGVIQPLVSQLKVSDLPVFGGNTPELQSQADAGVQQGIAQALAGGTLADLIGGE